MLGLGADLTLRQRARPFDPRALFAGGMQGIWIDPSEEAAVFADAAGTVRARVGDPVGRIADRSGRGNDAVQGVAAFRPMLRADAQGRRYLEFDGVDDFFEHGFGTAASDVTLLAAAQRSGGSGVLGLFSATPPGARLQAGIWSQAVAPHWGTYAAGAHRSAGADASIRSVLTVIGRTATDSQRLITNQGGAVDYTGCYPGDAENRRAIGREFNAIATGHFSGRLYGLFGAARALGDGELRQLIAYQAARAGIPA